jgi:uroporphyrinogen-III decarboxylase
MEICGCPINWRGTYETPATIPDPGFDLSRLNDVDVESVTSKGRFGTTIESLLRINRVMGSNLALAAVVSGPVTLILGLTGSDPLKDFDERPEEAVRAIELASQFLLKVVKIYCQLELDIIVIAERPLANFTRTHLSHLQSAFSPIVNMIRFYNAFSVLLPGDVNPDGLSEYIDFGFDSIVISNMTVDAWRDIKGNRPCVLGQAIPSHLVLSGGKGLTDYLENILPHREETGVFLTTDWEITPETPPDNIHMVMKIVSEY